MAARTKATEPQRNLLLNRLQNAFLMPLLMLKIRLICENARVAKAIVRAVARAWAEDVAASDCIPIK